MPEPGFPDTYVMFILGLITWTALLVVAWPYVQRVRDPRAKPLAAYLAFITVFTVVSAIIYSAGIALIAALGITSSLFNWPVAVLLLAAAFGSAFLAGRAYIRHPMPKEDVPN